MQRFAKYFVSSLTGAVLLGVWVLGGCSATTETGYEPKRLGMNEAQLKGLYAPAFTEGARAAQDAGESPVHAGH